MQCISWFSSHLPLSIYIYILFGTSCIYTQAVSKRCIHKVNIPYFRCIHLFETSCIHTARAIYSRANWSFIERSYVLVTRPFYSEAHRRGLYTAVCIVILAVMSWWLPLFVLWCPALCACACRSTIQVSVTSPGFICLQEYIGANSYSSWRASKPTHTHRLVCTGLVLRWSHDRSPPGSHFLLLQFYLLSCESPRIAKTRKMWNV
jgi:hypothetical protein